MTKEEAQKLRERIKKLRAVANPSSNAPFPERETAFNIAKNLEKKLTDAGHPLTAPKEEVRNPYGFQYQGYSNQAREKVGKEGDKDFLEGFLEDLLKNYGTSDFRQATSGPGGARIRYEDWQKFRQQAKEEFEKNVRENFEKAKEDFSGMSAEEDSRAFLWGIDIKEIKTYHCESGLYLIEQMTLDFLNQEIARLARVVQKYELENQDYDRYAYRLESAKLMKSRLIMERDSREEAKKNRTWRFRT